MPDITIRSQYERRALAFIPKKAYIPLKWSVEFLDERVFAELKAQALDIQASFLRIADLIVSEGLHKVREPYVKHLEGPIWEMRMKGRDGIARAAYVTAIRQRVVVVHVFAKKNAENAAARHRDCVETGRGGQMMRRFIPLDEIAEALMKEPAFREAYDALGDEFALASALIRARGDANMTQEQVAASMGTTQAVVARLESGRSLPSTRTLQRFAKATHSKLRISFEPEMTEREASLR